LFEHAFEQRAGQVALAGVGEDDDDGLAGVFVLGGEAQGDGRIAAPQLMPLMMPSSLARRRAVSMASSSVTCSTLSTRVMSRTSGLKPAPMP
jgi:hypothetical protein